MNRLTGFLRESLAIEGIHRDPTRDERDATLTFLDEELTVDTVLALQAVYAPGKPIRAQVGMNVQVGSYLAPGGGPLMRERIEHLLNKFRDDPWRLHVQFEMLHPFMDGNGRTGRSVWAWAMIRAGQDPFALSFLHRFYYQTLAAQQ